VRLSKSKVEYSVRLNKAVDRVIEELTKMDFGGIPMKFRSKSRVIELLCIYALCDLGIVEVEGGKEKIKGLILSSNGVRPVKVMVVE